MNLKKIVSAASALTIAASAFASMAVVANAAGESRVNAIASYSPYSTDAEIRINQKEGGLLKFDASAIKTAAAQAGENISAAKLNLKIASRSYNDKRSRWENTNVYTYYLVDGEIDVWDGSAKDWDAWNALAKTKIAEAWPDTTTGSVPSDGVTPYVDYTVDVKDALINDADGIVTFAFNTSTGRQHGIEIATAELAVTTTPKAPAGTVTVKYISGEDVLATKPVDVSDKFDGDDVTYYYPAYITAGDKTYKTTETAYGKKVALTTAAVEETVNYAPVDNVVAFQEAEDTTDITNKNTDWTKSPNVQYSNGNAVTVAKTDAYARYTVSVPEDAQYRFKMVGVGSGKARTANILVDDVAVGSIENAADGVVEMNTDVMLTAGTHTISYVANYSSLPNLDYLVVTKIGSYAAPKYDTGYFKFEAIDGAQKHAFTKATVTAKKGEEVKTGTADITTIDLSAGGAFYLNITGVPEGTEITSITVD